MNSVNIIGRLVRDPDLRTTSGGKSVANVSLAINRGDDATFIDVTIWGDQADNFCKFHTKGDMTAISGRLTQDQWEDRDSGQKRTKIKVTCESWSFASSKSESAPKKRVDVNF